jgi:7-cyano-7-deazaguanine synthase
MKSAILLSGGQDSASLAWWRRPDLAIFIDYGQVPALAERRAAEAVADELGLPIEIISVDCRPLGVGQLAQQKQIAAASTPEWWPFRNQLLITIAGAVGVKCGIGEVVIGTVLDDNRHADGCAAFVATMDALLGMQEGNCACVRQQ